MVIASITFLKFNTEVVESPNYMDYHQEVIRCEALIAEKKIEDARHRLDTLFSRFDFVFLREYKLATALSIHSQDYASAFRFLRLGMLHGWTIGSIKKDKNVEPLKKDIRWKELLADYDSLHKIYWSTLNIPLREEAQAILKADQKIALKTFIRIGEGSRKKYALKKFAPHSEKVLKRLYEILRQQGYPGEKLIGNGWWTSVSLSHHNSMDPAYTLKDTLYVHLRPELLKALARGELHPKEFAIMEDWKHATTDPKSSTLYGFVGEISDASRLSVINHNRNDIGLRSVDLRNKLLDIEIETGFDLYLPKGWQKGKIAVGN